MREFIQSFNTKRLEVESCSDDVAMTTFTKGLKKRKNKNLVRSLYLNPPEDFNSTMAWAKDFMLANEALDSSKDKERTPLRKQQKNSKGGESSNKRPSAPRSSPSPPRYYTILNRPCSEILNYIKEEGYTTQTQPPTKTHLNTRQNKTCITSATAIMGMIQWTATTSRSR